VSGGNSSQTPEESVSRTFQEFAPVNRTRKRLADEPHLSF
jgi:hypothetical protein